MSPEGFERGDGLRGERKGEMGGGQQHRAEAGKPFSVKGQIVNISGFTGHTISVVTTQLCR